MLPSLTLSLALTLASGFNLAPKYAWVLSDPSRQADSYFGFSVALLGGATPGLVIGAPRGFPVNQLHENVTQPGVVYFCGADERQKCDQRLPGEPEDYRELRNTAGSCLGASLGVQDSGAGVVVCAPRWSNWDNDTACKNSKSGICLFGLCYFMQNALPGGRVTVLNPPVDPKDLFSHGLINLIFRQAGMSVHLSQDGKEILLGATGNDRFKGGVIRYQYNGGNEIITTPTMQYMNTDDYSYFGYSVGAGVFDEGRTLYVGGAPRAADYRGKVFVFDFVQPTSGGQWDYSVVWEWEGRQMGEYFGAALCVADLNGDGLDDLLVGAPQHSLPSAGDAGAVYVFINSRTAGASKFAMQHDVTGSGRAGARFGTAISLLGDINQDGYPDVAVGAPYEDGGGAVYLYHGGKDGFHPRYSQRVSALDVNPSLRGFGASISRGADVDSNHYNDVAVGAYLSGSVVLLRSYPVVTLQPRLAASVDKVSLVGAPFTATACLAYHSPGVPSADIGGLDLEVRIKADPTYKRALFPNGGREFTYTSRLPQHGTVVCRNLTITINTVNNRDQLLKPIDLLMEYKPLPQTSTVFCKSCPVTDPGERRSLFLKVPIDTHCRDNAECKPDLSVAAEFVDVTSPFVIGSADTIRFKVTVANRNDPAYLTRVSAALPRVTPFKRIPPACQKAVPKGGGGGIGLQLQCDVDGALQHGEKHSLELELDMTNVPADLSLLQLNITAVSAGVEQNPDDNHAQLALPLASDVDVVISGISHPDQIAYGGEEGYKEEETFNHIYQVQNYGRSPAQALSLEFNIPTRICIDKTPTEILKVNYSQHYVGDPSFKCTSSDEQSGSQECSRNTHILEGVLEVDCTGSNALCITVTCSGVQLPSRRGLQASLRATVLLQHLKPLLEKHVIVVRSSGHVHVMVTPSATAPPENTSAVAATVQTVLVWDQLAEKGVDEWVVAGAVLGGMLLLLLLVGCLYKIGFFKRKKHMELQEALLQKGNPESDYENDG